MDKQGDMMNFVVAGIVYTQIACCCLVVLVVLKQFLKWFNSPLAKFPGPKERNNFFLGCFPQIRKEPFMQPHKRWWKEAGVETKIIYYTALFGRPGLLVLDKDICKSILSSPAVSSETKKGGPSRFHKQVAFVKNAIGDGLVTLEGEDWMRHRRILQPSFHTNFVKETLNSVVPPLVNRFVVCWERAAETGREIHVSSHLSALTLDVVGQAAFSHAFHGLRVVEEWSQKVDTGDSQEELAEIDDPFISSLLSSLKPNLQTMLFLLLGLAKYDIYFNARHRRMRRLLNEAVDQVIANAKKKGKDSSSNKSLLHLMLGAQDPESSNKKGGRTLTKTELRDEAKTFIVAGHETTSTWLYWAMFALAHHPDVQDRLYQDVVQHAPMSNNAIELEAVEKMDYLNAFLQEVLRLYPPVGFVTRQNMYPETIEGCHIPPKTRFVLPCHLLHRHPLYWDDPESFLPERWLNVSDADVERRRFAFIPFGGGVRNCIGYKFATIEALLIIAPLIRTFRVEIAPSQRDANFTFSTFITMKSKPSLKIAINKR